MKLRYILFILIILSSLAFFNPLNILPDKLGKLIYYALSLIALTIAIKSNIDIISEKSSIRYYYIVILGICISILMPTFFQNQSFAITLQATLPFIFGYSLLFIMLQFNIPVNDIEKTFVGIGIFSMFAFCINLITAPHCIFGSEIETLENSRGIVRIRNIPLQYVVFTFFYGINKWINTKERIWCILSSLSFLFIILSVTRQYIILSGILGALFLLRNINWIKKVVFTILAIAIIDTVLPNIPIYNKLKKISHKQMRRQESGKDDIRIRAYRFYTTQFQTNNISPFLGNGIPSYGNSPWGNHVQVITSKNHCYAIDIGWGGFYYYFGLFTTLALGMLFITNIIVKKQKEYTYTSYLLTFTAISAFTSGPILYNKQIVYVMSIFYIVYAQNNINRYRLHIKSIRLHDNLLYEEQQNDK